MEPDTALAARLASDLPEAFPSVVLAHQDRLFSIARRILGNPHDAEEAAQDAFVRAYRALEGWPAERILELRLRPWLATIVVNACRSRARRTASRPAELRLVGAGPTSPAEAARSVGEPRADLEAGPEATTIRREGAGRLATELAGLPERYRVPLVLRHVDGLSYPEMAEVLGKPEGTVKAQVHRGLALLRAAIEAEDRLAPADRPRPARLTLSPETPR